MLLFKYILFALLTYIVLVYSAYTIYFDTYIKNVVSQENKLTDLHFNEFENKSYKYLLNNQYIQANNILIKLGQTNRFEFVNINYERYFIPTKSILIHANKQLDLSWQLHDVSVDNKYGKLNKIDNLLYEIVASIYYDYDQALIIKSQASSYKKIVNIISRVEFQLPNYINKNLPAKNKRHKLINDFLKLKTNLINDEIIKKIYVNNNLHFATMKYKINNEIIYSRIYKELETFIIDTSYYYFYLFLLFIIFNYTMMQFTMNRSLKQLYKYTNDVLNNKFYRFDSNQLIYKNIKNISNDISALSKRMASIINEINVNKNMMELQISSDSLTKLPITKIFEQDMKSLFLFQVPSYIAKIKLICLSEYAENNSQEHTNNFIIDFVTNIQNTIKVNEQSNNIKLYRIYGSEFILIAQNFEYLSMERFLETIINENINIAKKYKINTKVAHIVSIPFDKYSNTQELSDKINLIYKKSKDNKYQISYYNEDNAKQIAKHSELEKVVESIITNNAFTLSYKYDTYEYSINNDDLYMQEVSPNLLNFDGSIIPIGIFISVASTKDIAINFDKNVILKTFKHIQKHQLKHNFAINISIESMKSNEFIIWLESQLLFDYKDIVNNVVFSITSFSAKNNFNEFIYFSSQIKNFDAKIILKRFNYNDLKLDQLELLNIDYIRVHSDYTNHIDTTKKSVLSNISNYCVNNDIILLADMVQNESDNNLLQSLNFYGTSK